MSKIFFIIAYRDLQIASRQGSATISVAIFFILSVTLFPLSIGSNLEILSKIAPGILWTAAILSNVISLDRIFQNDFEDGSLDLLVFTSLPLELITLSKALSHWLSTGLFLVILSPLLGLLLNLPKEGYWSLSLAMLLGTPTLSLIGMIGASLTVSIRRGGVLLSLLVLPLYIPVLIFGVDAISANIQGINSNSQFFLLGALFLFALVLAPVASAAALRINME
tara:strand:- start:623 stop:1291 length:669 start_codon:yes stop_codon:yes gene_type:complete